ncbi:unnamed protein product, partial [Ectocarpus sp. 4 AP-2014]
VARVVECQNRGDRSNTTGAVASASASTPQPQGSIKTTPQKQTSLPLLPRSPTPTVEQKHKYYAREKQTLLPTLPHTHIHRPCQQMHAIPNQHDVRRRCPPHTVRTTEAERPKWRNRRPGSG